MGLPEPPEEPEIISSGRLSPNALDLDDNIDEIDNQNIYEGYEPLPINANGADEACPAQDSTDSEEDDGSDNENQQEASGSSLPTIESAEASLVREVWQENNTRKDIEMNSEKVNAVKEAMQNFTLPAGNIPDWARNIPEDEWKDQVLKRIWKK